MNIRTSEIITGYLILTQMSHIHDQVSDVRYRSCIRLNETDEYIFLQ